MRLHVQSCTGGGHRGIQVRLLGEIEMQGTLFERDLSQDEVIAFNKGADAELGHPFGDDGVALQAMVAVHVIPTEATHRCSPSFVGRHNMGCGGSVSMDGEGAQGP